jgi:hypothetical protein
MMCGGGGADMARRARGKAAKRRRRSERIWTSASADASESVLPVAGSARFRRRVRVQGNGPRASRLRASGVRAVQEQCTGDATRRGDFGRSSYVGVPAVFQRHTCVSRGSSAREQKNPEVYRLIPGIRDIQQLLPFTDRPSQTTTPRGSS